MHWYALQAATPLAAVFTFFVRDMSGMIGGILFAFWQVGTSTTADMDLHTLLHA